MAIHWKVTLQLGTKQEAYANILLVVNVFTFQALKLHKFWHLRLSFENLIFLNCENHCHLHAVNFSISKQKFQIQ